MDKEEIDKRINRLVVATDPNEVTAAYAEWAEHYDTDLDEFGYIAPQLATDALVSLLESINAYVRLEYADYGKPLNIKDATYDAIISVGVYTARFEGYFLREMLRILKPGCHFLFSCRPHYYEGDVELQLEALKSDGLVASIDIQDRPYMIKQQANAFYITLSKPD